MRIVRVGVMLRRRRAAAAALAAAVLLCRGDVKEGRLVVLCSSGEQSIEFLQDNLW